MNDDTGAQNVSSERISGSTVDEIGGSVAMAFKPERPMTRRGERRIRRKKRLTRMVKRKVKSRGKVNVYRTLNVIHWENNLPSPRGNHELDLYVKR